MPSDRRDLPGVYPLMRLSVVIATCNRPDSVQRLLQSLLPQLRADRDELFIAENGTPVRLQFPALPFLLVHVHDVRAGKCRVQNRAIRAATGEAIVCLDDDLVVCPNYVSAVERFFTDFPQFAAMKGRVLPAEDPRRAVGPNWVYLDLPIVDHGDEVVEVAGVLGANMAFRTETLRQVGLFDERLGPGAAGHEEETEMSARLRRNGFRIGYAPQAVAYHEVDPKRANRERFLRVAHERGRCRVMHEAHRLWRVSAACRLAAIRLRAARLLKASPERIMREERRLAVAQGMLDGINARSPSSRLQEGAS